MNRRPVEWSDLSAAIQQNPLRDHAITSKMAGITEKVQKDIAVPWMPAGWSENKEHEVIDIVSLVLWIKEPMYRTATPAIKRAMEREENESLLTSIESAFTAHNGKARGWIKKHLEEAFSSLKEYKHNEFWKGVMEEKRMALIMDFVCIVRHLRVGLWIACQSVTSGSTACVTSDSGSGSVSGACVTSGSDSTACVISGSTEPINEIQGTVTIIPHISEQRSQIIQLNATTAHLLLDSKGSPFVDGKEWPALTMTKGFTWEPATSAPSIGSQTVPQIRARLLALGHESPANKKENRATLWKRVQWLELVKSLTSTMSSEELLSA